MSKLELKGYVAIKKGEILYHTFDEDGHGCGMKFDPYYNYYTDKEYIKIVKANLTIEIPKEQDDDK